ncbi:MAG: glycine cleavage system protein GcvH [Thermoguttaceae bacterium]|nr:glycine cleavage system protein GcvH [Thermoguttaceae bacterium]
MNIPQELFYSKEHEWVRFEGNKAYIGISDYAQHHLGDIVFVELPEIGAEFAPMTEAAVVESVKAVSPVFCPVAGKVVEVNEALLDTPEKVNEAPYESFLFAVETDGAGKENLLSAEAYAPLCPEEEETL